MFFLPFLKSVEKYLGMNSNLRIWKKNTFQRFMSMFLHLLVHLHHLIYHNFKTFQRNKCGVNEAIVEDWIWLIDFTLMSCHTCNFYPNTFLNLGEENLISWGSSFTTMTKSQSDCSL